MSDPRLSIIGDLLGGAPEHLVERSAAARAQAQGAAVEEVLAAWSGGEGLTAAPAALREAPPAPAPEAAPAAPAPLTEALAPAAVRFECSACS